MVQHTANEYTQFLQLRKEGKSYLEIARHLRILDSTIQNWLYSGVKPKVISERWEKSKYYHKKVSDPPKDITPEVAYLLGAICGDGHLGMYKRETGYNYRICLGVNDFDFAEAFQNCLKKLTKSEIPIKVYHSNITNKPRYVIQYCSIKWYYYFSNIKDNLFMGKIDMDEQSQQQFIKGLFDAEGSVYVGKNKRGYGGKIRIYNTNRHLLEITQNILARLGCHSCLYAYSPSKTTWKQPYALTIHRRQSVFYFISTISSSIARKREKMVDYMRKWKKK